MAYELWRISTGNLQNTYASQAEALAVVLTVLQARGPEEAADFALGYENRRGQTRAIATGEELVRLATSSSLRAALEHIVALAQARHREQSVDSGKVLEAIEDTARAALAGKARAW